MTKLLEIVHSERNKIVLALAKPKFLHLQFSNSYLKINALNLALLAEVVYRSEGEIRQSLFRYSFDDQREKFITEADNVRSPFVHVSPHELKKIENSFSFLEVKESDSQLFHFDYGNCIVVAFRGTAGRTDIFTDLKSSIVDFTEGVGKVHQGFVEAFRSVRERLDQLAAKPNGNRFIITGHSLGGALATLAAAYIKQKFGADIMLYTFGSPRVGDADFVKHYTSFGGFHYFRVVNNEDIITMIPPPYSNLRLGLVPLALSNPFFLIPATIDPFGKPFTHIGKPVFIRRISMEAVSVDVDRKQPYYIKVSAKLVGTEDRPKWETLIDWAPFCASDHSMKRYISILASDLKLAIGNYLESRKLSQENARKTIAYLSKEVEDLDKKKDALEREQFATPYPSHPDATGPAGQTPSRQTPAEKLQKVTEALQVKQIELLNQKAKLTAMSSPGYPKAVLKEIIGSSNSSGFEREFEYHLKTIKY